MEEAQVGSSGYRPCLCLIVLSLAISAVPDVVACVPHTLPQYHLYNTLQVQAALARARAETSKRDRIQWDAWRSEHTLDRHATPGPKFFDEKAYRMLSGDRSIPSVHIAQSKEMRENELIAKRMSQTPGPGLYVPATTVGEDQLLTTICLMRAFDVHVCDGLMMGWWLSCPRLTVSSSWPWHTHAN